MHNHNGKKNSSTMWMMLICILPLVVLLFAGGKLFSDEYLWPIFIGAFVVAHLWMMFGGHKGHKHNKVLYKCPECGLEYEEKSWAEKCEAWCGEHKSCNLEITSHAEENKTK